MNRSCDYCDTLYHSAQIHQVAAKKQSSHTCCEQTPSLNEIATPATTEDTLLPFDHPAVQRKKVAAAVDGGLISSDGGLVLLFEVERRLRLARTLAGCIREWQSAGRLIDNGPHCRPFCLP